MSRPSLSLSLPPHKLAQDFPYVLSLQRRVPYKSYLLYKSKVVCTAASYSLFVVPVCGDVCVVLLWDCECR